MNLWACSVNCSLVTEWGRCWFCPAPLVNLPPTRIRWTRYRRTAVGQSATACAYHSRRQEGRCLNSFALLWPGPRWTAGKEVEPPYRCLMNHSNTNTNLPLTQASLCTWGLQNPCKRPALRFGLRDYYYGRQLCILTAAQSPIMTKVRSTRISLFLDIPLAYTAGSILRKAEVMRFHCNLVYYNSHWAADTHGTDEVPNNSI